MPNITFQQLEAFLTAAERLSLTEAASALYISQSALSKTITRLETSTGLRLFNRENRGVSLTAEGKFLYSSIKEPANDIIKAIAEARMIRDKPSSSLRIGCTSSYDYNFDYNPAKKAVSEFRAAYPDIKVSETIYEIDSLRQALIFSTVDIIISQSFVVSDIKDVNSMEIGKLGTFIVLSSNHPAVTEYDVDMSMLNGETYHIIVGRENYDEDLAERTRKSVRDMCKQLGFVPGDVGFVPNMATLIHTLGTGKGVSVAGRIENIPADVQLKYHPVPKHLGLQEYHITAAWLKKTHSAQVANFVEILKKHAKI